MKKNWLQWNDPSSNGTAVPSEVPIPVVVNTGASSNQARSSLDKVMTVQAIFQSENAPLRNQILQLASDKATPKTGGQDLSTIMAAQQAQSK